MVKGCLLVAPKVGVDEAKLTANVFGLVLLIFDTSVTSDFLLRDPLFKIKIITI